MSVAVIDRNDVVLRGRLSAPAVERVLPSGDPVMLFRLRMRRPEREGRQVVDTLACVTYDRALQRRVAGWRTGDVVEVEGALQRRFWRTPTGTASVHELNCRRGRKAPPSGHAPDARSA